MVAFSSGNHAQGVALAAKLLGMPALIVMPSDAPAVKVEATRGYGAEIKLYDRLTESREAIAAEVAQARGAVVVPAFDDLDIIAGQGTVGLELVRQGKARGVDFDVVVSPIGGGGLMAGVSTAVKALSPQTAVVGVEPEAFDDTLRSLQKGERIVTRPTTRSLCDALESPAPGELTFPIMLRNVADVALVGDAEVAEAMRYAFSVLKLVVEPGGAWPCRPAERQGEELGRRDHGTGAVRRQCRSRAVLSPRGLSHESPPARAHENSAICSASDSAIRAASGSSVGVLDLTGKTLRTTEPLPACGSAFPGARAGAAGADATDRARSGACATRDALSSIASICRSRSLSTSAMLPDPRISGIAQRRGGENLVAMTASI